MPPSLKKHLERLEALEVNDDRFPKNDNIKLVGFLYINTNKLNLHFLEGTFEKGLYLVNIIEYGIKKHKATVLMRTT
jgi:hypothetical protein